jgi:hypothetical protein
VPELRSPPRRHRHRPRRHRPQVASARLLDLDRLGMNLEVSRAAGEAPFKLRLPFTKAAEERKGIKDAIVEMTRAAKGAAAAAAAQGQAQAQQGA